MRRARPLLIAAAAMLGSACSAEIPDATYVCDATSDCPPGFVCDPGRRLCVRSFDAAIPMTDAGPCEPGDCAGLRAQCGMIDDGCGTPIDCGDCTAPETCGGGGIANICDCEPRTCADLGATCGDQPNGCGGTLDCGACDAPDTCGGGGVENECGCTATDPCPGLCGDQIDDCGGTVTCPDCPTGQDCGAVTPNMCGVGTCVPMATTALCMAAGRECGPLTNNCGDPVSCGTCRAPDTCGGGGAATGICGCSPRSCAAPTVIECGGVPDGCGTDLSCGECGDGERCNATNRCLCAPDGGEDNETGGTAHRLGTLTRPVVQTYTEYSLHAAGDRDFFVLSVTGPPSGSASLLLRAELTVPPGADYDLGVWYDCGGFASDLYACRMGTMDGSHLSGGCIASAGSSVEVVLMDVPCLSFDLLIGINGPVNVCAPYTLRLLTDM